MAQCKTCSTKASLKRHKEHHNKIMALKNKPCADCGLVFLPCAMDFDHRIGEEKLFQFNAFQSWERTLKELSKCDLVCSNCHRIRTWKRQQKS